MTSDSSCPSLVMANGWLCLLRQLQLISDKASIESWPVFFLVRQASESSWTVVIMVMVVLFDCRLPSLFVKWYIIWLFMNFELLWWRLVICFCFRVLNLLLGWMRYQSIIENSERVMKRWTKDQGGHSQIFKSNFKARKVVYLIEVNEGNSTRGHLSL